MTREEVIEIVRRMGDRPWYEAEVDGLVALGLLKLDDPDATLQGEALAYLQRQGYPSSAYDIMDAFNRGGFRVVKK